MASAIVFVVREPAPEQPLQAQPECALHPDPTLRLRIRHPLFAGFVGVVVLLVLLVVVLAGRGIRRKLTRTTADALARELVLAPALAEAAPADTTPRAACARALNGSVTGSR